MNLGLDEVQGAVLAVSQFTLAGSIAKGRRPGFDDAMAPEPAAQLFERFVARLRAQGVTAQTGVFRADDAGGAGQRRPGDLRAGFEGHLGRVDG